MKQSSKSGAKIAITAAALLVSGSLAGAAMAGSAEGKCMGVNTCKGTSACKTAENACGGQNSCKGKGWLAMTKEDCDAKGGKWEAKS
ncbi:MAG: hypothetical protein AAF405_00670 [Pseudomonadota bacterium]